MNEGFSVGFKKYIFEEMEKRAREKRRLKNPKIAMIILGLLLADRALDPRILQELRFDSKQATGEEWSTYVAGCIVTLAEEISGARSKVDDPKTCRVATKGMLAIWQKSSSIDLTGVIVVNHADFIIAAFGDKEKIITAKLYKAMHDFTYADVFPEFAAMSSRSLT